MSRIRGVIFDLDGTLFDSHYDWPAIKRALGVTGGDRSLLEQLDALPAERAAERHALLERFEDRATAEGVLRPAARPLLGSLRRRGMCLGLVTNNRAVNARRVIERYDLVFDTVWTRDDGAYKPSAEPIRRAAERLGLAPDQLAAVGDNELDLRAARGAGVGLVLTVNPDVERFRAASDLAAADLDGLTPLLLAALGAGLTLPD